MNFPSNDQLIVLSPIVIIGLIMLVKLVRTLTSHQQKMAEMISQQQRALIELENRRLTTPPVDLTTQRELESLRDRLVRMETELAESKSNENTTA